MPFRDADAEVEAAAGRPIAEIFEQYGEAAFRDGERRVIARLLDEPPHVLATGGGAFMTPETRALIKAQGDLGLAEGRHRGAGPPGRPQGQPPAAGRQGPAGRCSPPRPRDRYPVYAEADIAVETGDTAAPGGRGRDPRRRWPSARGGDADAVSRDRAPSRLAGRPTRCVIGRGPDRRGRRARSRPLLKRPRLAVVIGRDRRAACTARGWPASLDGGRASTAQPWSIAPGEAAKSFAGLEELATRCWRWSSTAAT